MLTGVFSCHISFPCCHKTEPDNTHWKSVIGTAWSSVFYVIAQSLGKSPNFCGWDAFTTFTLGISTAISSHCPENIQLQRAELQHSHRKPQKSGHLHLRPQEFFHSCHVFRVMESQSLKGFCTISTKMTCIFLMNWCKPLTRVFTCSIHQNQTKRIESDVAALMQVQGNQQDESSYKTDQSLKSMLLQEI